MNKIIISSIVIIAILPMLYFGGIIPISSDSYGLSPVMEYEELMEKSQIVVKGKIVGSQVNVEFFDQNDMLVPDITTTWTLDIKKLIKGNHTGTTVDFVTQGGTYNNMKHTAMHGVDVNIGDKMVIFLAKEPASIWGDNYYVAGAQSGVYKIKDTKAENDFLKKSFDESDFENKLKSNKHANK